MNNQNQSEQDAEQAKTLLPPTENAHSGLPIASNKTGPIKKNLETSRPSTGIKTSRARLWIRILSFLLTAVLVVVLAHAVSVYYSSRNKTMYDDRLQMDVRVWPNNIKMRPTLLLLGAASAATLLSGILCVASFSKVVRRITNVSNILTLVVSTVAIALWVAVGALYKADDLNPDEHWDMLSFTCARKHDAELDRAIGNLASLCSQMRYAWWVTIAVAVLEIAALATVARGWWACRNNKEAAKGTYQVLGVRRGNLTGAESGVDTEYRGPGRVAAKFQEDTD